MSSCSPHCPVPPRGLGRLVLVSSACSGHWVRSSMPDSPAMIARKRPRSVSPETCVAPCGQRDNRQTDLDWSAAIDPNLTIGMTTEDLIRYAEKQYRLKERKVPSPSSLGSKRAKSIPSGPLAIDQTEWVYPKQLDKIRGNPPIYAQTRQELCETLPYFRSFHSGHYISGGVTMGYLLDGCPSPRDAFGDSGKVIISHGGGGSRVVNMAPQADNVDQQANGCSSQRKTLSRLVLTQSQRRDGYRVRSLLECMERHIPVVLIAGTNYAKMPWLKKFNDTRYAVLGFYTVTHAWVSSCDLTRFGPLDHRAPFFLFSSSSSSSSSSFSFAKAEREPNQVNQKGPLTRFKFRFQWMTSQGDPWWLSDLGEYLESQISSSALEGAVPPSSSVDFASRPNLSANVGLSQALSPSLISLRLDEPQPRNCQSILPLETAPDSRPAPDRAVGSRQLTMATSIDDPLASCQLQNPNTLEARVVKCDPNKDTFDACRLILFSWLEDQKCAEKNGCNLTPLLTRLNFQEPLHVALAAVKEFIDLVVFSSPLCFLATVLSLEKALLDVASVLEGRYHEIIQHQAVTGLLSFAPRVPPGPRDPNSQSELIDCSKCGQASPCIYISGWVCLNEMCEYFFQPAALANNPCGHVRDGQEVFLPWFLKHQPKWEKQTLVPYQLQPPSLQSLRGQDLHRKLDVATKKGTYCENCGRLSCRLYWACLMCQNVRCEARVMLEVDRVLKAWQLKPNQNSKLGGYRFSDEILGLSGVMPNFSFACYHFPNNSGYVIHGSRLPSLLRGNAYCTEDAANEILEQYQVELDPFTFRRNPFRRSAAGMVAQQFTMNCGEAYKFCTDVRTIPWEMAPKSVHNACGQITRFVDEFNHSASQYVDGKRLPSGFNEVLSCCYFAGSGMSFHADDECGVGELIGSLSLGSKAVMRFKRKVARRESATYKGKNPVVLEMVLNHGDIVLQFGHQLQIDWVHAVSCEGFRIAATARNINPTLMGTPSVASSCSTVQQRS